jgi:hypothetical protein
MTATALSVSEIESVRFALGLNTGSRIAWRNLFESPAGRNELWDSLVDRDLAILWHRRKDGAAGYSVTVFAAIQAAKPGEGFNRDVVFDLIDIERKLFRDYSG